MSAITEKQHAGDPLPERAECGDRLHAVAARRIVQMDPAERPAALEALPNGESLAAFLEMRPAAQASVLEHMGRDGAARLADRLPFNTLARVLDAMSQDRRREIVEHLRPLKRSRVETVLSTRLNGEGASKA